MRLALNPHPDTPPEHATAVEVEVATLQEGRLSLLYLVNGLVAELRLPEERAPTFRQDLWKHSCFELFLRAGPQDYYEFNFSPSSEWAAFRFAGYRNRIENLVDMTVPVIRTHAGRQRFELRCLLDLRPLVPQGGAAGARLGLSAVIEEASGRTSYWALAHPPGKPDFHHSDCFALELAAASRR